MLYHTISYQPLYCIQHLIMSFHALPYHASSHHYFISYHVWSSHAIIMVYDVCLKLIMLLVMCNGLESYAWICHLAGLPHPLSTPQSWKGHIIFIQTMYSFDVDTTFALPFSFKSSSFAFIEVLPCMLTQCTRYMQLAPKLHLGIIHCPTFISWEYLACNNGLQQGNVQLSIRRLLSFDVLAYVYWAPRHDKPKGPSQTHANTSLL